MAEANNQAIPVKGPMANPPHIGGFIRRNFVEASRLQITEAAEALNVDRTALSRLLNEKSSLSWDMAMKIEKTFGHSAEHLMRMQHSYDAAQARKRIDKITVNRTIEIDDNSGTTAS